MKVNDKSKKTIKGLTNNQGQNVDTVIKRYNSQNLNGQNDLNDYHMLQLTTKESLVKILDKTILKYFQDLVNEDNKKRTEASLQLLQQLAKIRDVEQEKALSYTLKRLVRGCGATTNNARAGFYTGLVALLQAYSSELSLELVFEMLEKELHVGSTITNREDADAIVGKILVCGAVLHAKRLESASHPIIENITNILVLSTNFRTYHAALGYAFITEILEEVTESQFSKAIWPVLQKKLSQPWNKQNIQSIQCIIIAQRKFPQIVNDNFLKTNFGDTELINKESYTYLYKIFWQHTNADILTHPAFEQFAIYAGTCKNLGEFWQTAVEQHLPKTSTKLGELITIKLLSDILNNLDTKQTKVSQLLTNYFMKFFVDGLKNVKQKKDETRRAFYTELTESLVKCCMKLNDDKENIAIIKRLVLHPGTFNIEKYTSTRIVHQIINCLGEAGIKDIFIVFKNIFMDKITKLPDNTVHWLNFERLNAGYMLQNLLQQKNIQKAYKWREEQLKFFLTYGLFYVDANMEICKKDAVSTFSNDFGEQCKNIFYTCLQSKVTDLHEERKLLLNLASFCNTQIENNNIKKYIRVKNIDNSVYSSWKRMYNAVSQSSNVIIKIKDEFSNDSNKLHIIFHILLINMGFQLFNDPEMAVLAVDDLLKCLERTRDKKTAKLKKKISFKTQEEIDDEEIEWIEVVVDLFLHLLSQSTSALRQTVNALFPHLCKNLNLNAVHHILSMLNMKDGYNPLSTKAEQTSEDDGAEEEENDGKMENDESDDSENNGYEDDDGEVDDEDEDDENDDDSTDEENEDEITNNDKLRIAVSQALMETGADVFQSNSGDDDIVSLDLNDISEEEGRKLDEALANAFKSIKESKDNRRKTDKKNKKYYIQVTTVMHFRIRVLDLIEIYLQQQPSLMILNEIMIALFDMLKYCITEELKPLQNKVHKVLTKLTSMKVSAVEPEFNEQNLVDFMRLLIEDKTASYELTNKLRNKCVIFLINNITKVCGTNRPSKIIKILENYFVEFVNTRNPLINISLITDIFRLRWSDLLELGVILANKGVTPQSRTFRRIQIFDILTILYKNYELQKLNLEKTRVSFMKIEEIALSFINEIPTQSTKEFHNLLEFIIYVQKAHTRLNSQSKLCSKDTCNAIQTIRQRIHLESMQLYQRYCALFHLEVLQNTDSAMSTGIWDEKSESGDEKIANEFMLNGNAKKRQLDVTNYVVDNRKIKKKKKYNRLEFASRKLNDGPSFA